MWVTFAENGVNFQLVRTKSTEARYSVRSESDSVGNGDGAC